MSTQRLFFSALVATLICGWVYGGGLYARVPRGNAAEGSLVINTIVGSGQSGYSGDGGQATDALISAAVGDVTYDAAGNLYLADHFNHVIRRVDATGLIETIVGTGVPGDVGDGGMATDAQLNDPRGVAIDAVGNLYVADRDNSKVRKVAPDGTISTFFSILGPDKVEVDGDGNVFVLSGFLRVIHVLNPGGSVVRTVPANFGDIAVDQNGVIFHSDIDLEQVVRIDLNGDVTRIAGQGDGIEGFAGDGGQALTARFANPGGVAVDVQGVIDAAGSVFVSDRQNSRVRVIRPDGTIDTVAGDGTAAYCGEGVLATTASLLGPWGLAFDPSGKLSFIDETRVRQLSLSANPPEPIPCATPTSTPSGPTATPTSVPPEPTPTPSPDGCADFDNDGLVDKDDLIALIGHLGARRYEAQYDLNGDGKVSGRDLVAALRQFGSGC